MTRAAPGKIGLDDFVLEMMHVSPPDLKLSRLEDLFGRLDLRPEFLDSHIHFARNGYSRNLICRTPRFDMLLLCWKPGDVTTIHDHAGSLNVTRVYRGSMTSRTFEVVDRPAADRRAVRLAQEEELGPGRSSSVDVDGIHQLANTSKDELVTLHVYASPLKEITIYYPGSGRFERATLRYTLEDEFA